MFPRTSCTLPLQGTPAETQLYQVNGDTYAWAPCRVVGWDAEARAFDVQFDGAAAGPGGVPLSGALWLWGNVYRLSGLYCFDRDDAVTVVCKYYTVWMHCFYEAQILSDTCVSVCSVLHECHLSAADIGPKRENGCQHTIGALLLSPSFSSLWSLCVNAGGLKTKEVKRLNLRFKAEDPHLFERRVSEAKVRLLQPAHSSQLVACVPAPLAF